jgi:hypothetical protein
MAPEDRDRLRGTYRKFKELPEDKRRQLKEELDQLRDVDPPTREQQRQEIYRKYFPKK